MIKIVFEDRVSNDHEEKFFSNLEDAYFHLWARLSGLPKVVEVQQREDGAVLFIFHDYIIKGEGKVILIAKP